jgi:hypothetical protein
MKLQPSIADGKKQHFAPYRDNFKILRRETAQALIPVVFAIGLISSAVELDHFCTQWRRNIKR